MKVELFTAETQSTQRISIVCRSDFSRELQQFATKVAPTNTCNYLCVLCASAVKSNRLIIEILRMVGLGEEEPALGQQACVLDSKCQCEYRENT